LARFRAIWVASTTGYLGIQVTKFVLPLLATSITSSPSAVAAVALAMTVPWLVIGLPAGAIVDRMDRRQVLVVANAVRIGAVGTLVLAGVAGQVQLPLIYACAVALGCAEVFAETATRVIVPMVVPPEQLDGANARLYGGQSVVEIAALPIGGALTAIGFAFSSGAGVVCFAGALVALAGLRGRFTPERMPGDRRLLAEVGEGLRFLWSNRLLRTIGIMAAVINACWSAWGALLVLYAVSPGPMGLSEFDYALMLTAGGVGGLVGTMLTGRLHRRFGQRWGFGINIVVNAVMMAMTALTASPWLNAPAILIGDSGGPLWGIAWLSLQARIVPDGLRGRIGSAYRFISYGSMALGAAVGGVAAEVVGLRLVFAGCAVLTAAMLLPFARVVTVGAVRGEAIGDR
jgi:MFS family permease